jgi:hypothetical protein
LLRGLEAIRIEIAILGVVIVNEEPCSESANDHTSQLEIHSLLTVVGVEDFPDKQEEPLLAKATGINTLLSNKFNTKSLLDFFGPSSNRLAHGAHAVLD